MQNRCGGAYARYLLFPGNLFFELLFLSQRLLLSAKRAIASGGGGGGEWRTRGKRFGHIQQARGATKPKRRHCSIHGGDLLTCAHNFQNSRGNNQRCGERHPPTANSRTLHVGQTTAKILWNPTCLYDMLWRVCNSTHATQETRAS